jgi:hypothetical protein
LYFSGIPESTRLENGAASRKKRLKIIRFQGSEEDLTNFDAKGKVLYGSYLQIGNIGL